MLNDILNKLNALSDPDKAAKSLRYFKTDKGEYGEGDIFIGLSAPQLRALSKEHQTLPVLDCFKLLKNKIHEARMLALFILVLKFKKADPDQQTDIFQQYLQHSQFINNWDLVDCSAPHISGPYLLHREKQILYKLATSDLLWDRRIAMLSCFSFIRDHQFEDALKLSKLLLNDKEDLIHKAVGWMLREIGKRDGEVERAFLDAHANTMPRVMLRYAIEKFNQAERQHYLSLK